MNCTLLLALVAVVVNLAEGLITNTPVSQLLRQYDSDLAALQAATSKVVGSNDVSAEPYSSSVFYLRYCLDSDDPSQRLAKLQKNLSWRMGPGKTICESAASAVQQATATGAWNNAPVLAAAPHASVIGTFLTPKAVLTTTSEQGDLVYCIRAGQIDDNGLMKRVTIDQMVDFFLYAKEVNALVANQRSLQTDQLVSIITANDLSGVGLGGSADFRKALSQSAKTSNDLYPATAGPTLLLNLPPLLNALVTLFTPLFPPAVNKRLKFSQGLLKDIDSLTEITAGGSKRSSFLQQLNEVVYQ